LIEMLESPAYRVLSLSGRRILDRIEIEHAHHGGADNGRLPVRYEDFERYGMDPHSVPPGLREVQALGFVIITERGRPSKSDFGRHPNVFLLTYLPGAHGEEPTNDWRQFKTLEHARAVAQKARGQKDENAVAKSKKAWKKSDARGGKILVTGSKNHPVTTDLPRSKNQPTVPGLKTHPTIYIPGRDEDAA
jgi:hypothetical protein